MNRTTYSLGAVVIALAAVTGVASLSGGGTATTGAAAAPARLPVERSSGLCPAPDDSETADTTYTSFAPKGTAAAPGDESAAVLVPAVEGTAPAAPSGSPSGKAGDGTKDAKDAKDAKDGKDGKDAKDGAGSKTPAPPSPSDASGAPAPKPLLSLKQPGTPATVSADDDPTALVGTATGALAPGWTTQETTSDDVGVGRGLSGLTCTSPDTDFWLPGASTAKSRSDYVDLTNPDDSAAVADIQLYGKSGALKSDTGDGLPVPAHGTVAVLLSTLTSQAEDGLTVHVTTRSGRVGAAVRAADSDTGGDWLPPAADPSPTLVMPGIPADATDVRLTVFAPGQNDADLNLKLFGPSGGIVPAGHESLHVKSGMTTTVDLADVTRKEAGSLQLAPSGSGQATPVVAALQVLRGKGDDREMAFIPATAPVTARASAADNRAKGSTLSLVAPGATAQVKVTASAGSKGGTATTKTYTVKGGTTLAVAPPVPAGLKGSYALTVEPQSGGPVYAARTLALPQGGVPAFTVQTLPDDRGTVSVPQARQDLSILKDDD
ncbi:DUF5719 family protein [Streptomyces fuscigenes]|uniref:DUF5719 family protein n=1 Tax=Streptomyces fuscigenes TaxID=1528880 RepID=UPI001F3B1FBF|nr:DUF5719 family protein [Streptomyces fuscigenes]MCF3961796.1 DUF5719 family protein [Streptomyces fuscigenes]